MDTLHFFDSQEVMNIWKPMQNLQKEELKNWLYKWWMMPEFYLKNIMNSEKH